MPENELIEKTGLFKLNETILAHLPKATRYIDPFYPGFGILPVDKFQQFAINIIDKDLFDFIKTFRNNEVQSEVKLFLDAFPLLSRFGNEVTEELKVAINDFNDGNINKEDLTYMVRVIIVMNIDSPHFAPLFNEKFIIYLDRFIEAIERNLIAVTLVENTSAIPLNKLVNKALYKAFNEHWNAIAKDHQEGKTHNLFQTKYLTIKFICSFLNEESVLKKMKEYFSLYKYDEPESLKAILSAFNHIPHSHTVLSHGNPSQFIATLNLNKGDFILIDSELNVDANIINQIITQANNKACYLMIIEPEGPSQFNALGLTATKPFEFGQSKFQCLINYK